MYTALRQAFLKFHSHRRSPLWGIAQYCFVMGGLIWLTLQGAEDLGYDWQWFRVGKYLYTMHDGNFTPGPLLSGLFVTFEITLYSMALSLLFGLTAMLLRQSSSFVGHAVAVGYIETIRNTPLLIQLYIIYFVIAPVLSMSPFSSAVFALSLFEGAYMAEIFRAGIASVPKGQWEASQSMGMPTHWTYIDVVLPQAIRNVLPPLTGQAITLVKDSALVATISVFDMTMQGQAIIAETFLTFEIWFTISAIYLAVNFSLSLAVYAMERKLRYDF